MTRSSSERRTKRIALASLIVVSLLATQLTTIPPTYAERAPTPEESKSFPEGLPVPPPDFIVAQYPPEDPAPGYVAVTWLAQQAGGALVGATGVNILKTFMEKVKPKQLSMSELLKKQLVRFKLVVQQPLQDQWLKELEGLTDELELTLRSHVNSSSEESIKSAGRRTDQLLGLVKRAGLPAYTAFLTVSDLKIEALHERIKFYPETVDKEKKNLLNFLKDLESHSLKMQEEQKKLVKESFFRGSPRMGELNHGLSGCPGYSTEDAWEFCFCVHWEQINKFVEQVNWSKKLLFETLQNQNYRLTKANHPSTEMMCFIGPKKRYGRHASVLYRKQMHQQALAPLLTKQRQLTEWVCSEINRYNNVYTYHHKWAAQMNAIKKNWASVKADLIMR